MSYFLYFLLISIWFRLDITVSNILDSPISTNSKNGNFLSSSLLYISEVGKLFPKSNKLQSSYETDNPVTAIYKSFSISKVWEYKYILSIWINIFRIPFHKWDSQKGGFTTMKRKIIHVQISECLSGKIHQICEEHSIDSKTFIISAIEKALDDTDFINSLKEKKK